LASKYRKNLFPWFILGKQVGQKRRYPIDIIGKLIFLWFRFNTYNIERLHFAFVAERQAYFQQYSANISVEVLVANELNDDCLFDYP